MSKTEEILCAQSAGKHLRQDEDADAGRNTEPGGVERGRQEVCAVQEHARQRPARVLQPATVQQLRFTTGSRQLPFLFFAPP